MFKEVFVSKIQSPPRNGSTLIKDPNLDNQGLDLFLVFDRMNNALCWMELHKGTISKRKMKLSNIDPIMQIVSIYNVVVGHYYLLIVISKLPEKEQNQSGGYYDHYQKPYHMHTYSIEVEQVTIRDEESDEPMTSKELRFKPFQGFPIDYCPLSISLDYYTDIPFLFINGSNNSLHAYEIDIQSLKLHRGPHRDALRAYWETRLRFNRDKGANVSSNISMPLGLIIERASFSNQLREDDGMLLTKKEVKIGLETTAVLGYSSGLLSWTSTSYIGGSGSQPFGRVLLLDSPVICLAAISRFKNIDEIGDITPSNTNLKDGKVDNKAIHDFPGERLHRGISTTHVIAGMAEGAAIISLESMEAEPVMLPSIHQHGFVRAIAVGDITGNGYDDFVIGFEDGTVVGYARKLLAADMKGEEQNGIDKNNDVYDAHKNNDRHDANEKEKTQENDTEQEDGQRTSKRDTSSTDDRAGSGEAMELVSPQGNSDTNRSMDLTRDVLDSSYELYDMGEGDEDEDEEDDEEEDDHQHKGEQREAGGDTTDGSQGAFEEFVQDTESPAPSISHTWRPSHHKLAFREFWRTWLPFPIRDLAFSSHLQIPFSPASDTKISTDQHIDEERSSDYRKGAKFLSVVTTNSLHCFALMSTGKTL